MFLSIDAQQWISLAFYTWAKKAGLPLFNPAHKLHWASRETRFVASLLHQHWLPSRMSTPHLICFLLHTWLNKNTFSATKCQSATSLLLLLFEVSTSGDPAALYFRRAENSDPQTSSDWNCFRNFRRIGKPASGAVRQSRCVGAVHPLHRRNWRHHSTARPDQQRYPGRWK